MRPVRLQKSSGVMPEHIQALGRLKSGQMNKTEESYAKLLEAKLFAHEIAWWRFEGMTFKLADDTRYTPDFMVMYPDGRLEAHETKGFWRDDALIKIKVAASMFPIRFLAFTKANKKDGGGWKEREF